jgi:hypothetical protein
LIGCFAGGLAVVPGKAHISRLSASNQVKRICSRCHNLGVVRAQHLSRHEWERELVKMSLMGAKIDDRARLLDYLTKHYGDSRPAPKANH